MILARYLALIISVFFLSGFALSGQTTVQINGTVTDDGGKPIEFVNVAVKNNPSGTITNQMGHFTLKVNGRFPFFLQFSSIGYEPAEVLISGPAALLNPVLVTLKQKTELIGDVEVKANFMHDQSMTRIDAGLTHRVPDATGGSIESLIKTQIGVASNNELSSQYRVRGGNFDENLVYVNDIEIYRPFLVRSGQQEGLSFANPDLVSSLLFSPGGFNASYGDKMSSVLDIKYKKPTHTAASVNASFLGASTHFEGVALQNKLSFMTGVRYKTNQYLLGSLDTKGDYSPRFFDAQTYLTYQLLPNLELNALGYFSQNNYSFVPTNRETRFGTISEVKQLMVYFEGQEIDRFQTGFGAISLNYNRLSSQYKLILSGFRTYEEESFDILGEYWLQDLDPISGEPANPREPVKGIGVGGFLQHARNELLGRVMNVALKGNHRLNDHQLSWETKVQTERFTDYLNEWEKIDSAGYSVPYAGNNIILSYAYNANLEVNSVRFTAYLMDTYAFNIGQSDVLLNLGSRLNYWDFNNELLISPRANLTLTPHWKRDVRFRFASGIYYQSPFYKELRSPQGIINNKIKAQKSVHLMLGGDLFFESWGRPFKFTTEAYYKHLDNLITYQVDNVRIRYSGVNDAKGYATGLDLKVNGEFVEGVESWVSVGIMKTMEDLYNDSYPEKQSDGSVKTVYPGYIARPSDQRVNFAMFFQDYLPRNPSFKVHLNLIYATGLPFGPPKSERFRAVYRTPDYRRTDIGFSKDLLYKRQSQGNTLFKKLWVGAEIFNLFDISNTISYYWVSDVNNRQYAVPNYLTSRRVSVHLTANF